MFHYDRQFKWMEQSVAGRWCPSKLGRTGTQLYDLSGYNNTSTLIGMDPATDWTDEGLDFDGSNDYATVSTLSALTLYPFTLSGWFYQKSLPPSGNFDLPYAIGIGNNNYFGMGFQNSSGQLRPCVVGRNTSFTAISFPTNLLLDTWYHFTAVFEATNSRVLYVDGLEVGTTTNFVAQLTANSIVRFGSAFGTFYADTTVNDLILFSSKVEPSQILDLYHAGPGAGLSLSPKRSTMMYPPITVIKKQYSRFLTFPG